MTYNRGGHEIEVYYNRPSKKGRVIFGDLVPFEQVWRTGANEPSTFYTKNDLIIAGQTLTAGKYSLWTIPKKDSWEVIFNNKMYSWGVDPLNGGKASREAEYDVLNLEMPVHNQEAVTEMLTIGFNEEQPLFFITWDKVKIESPFNNLKSLSQQNQIRLKKLAHQISEKNLVALAKGITLTESQIQTTKWRPYND